MIFTSLSYLLFLPFVFFATFLLPKANRIIFLVLCSYFFYMSWKVEYGLIVFFLTCIDYLSAKIISSSKKPLIRKISWIFSIFANLGTLFAFKYFGFFLEEFNSIALAFNIAKPLSIFDVILPIGISFHTFQSISYTTDVYRNPKVYEPNFVKLALYIIWFPQLVAGPIERSQSIIPQFSNISFPDKKSIISGLRLIAFGLVKKLVVSDNLSPIVEAAYGPMSPTSTMVTWIGFYGFALQIFCDFSGYTDIARGSSMLFGIQLSQNFDRPYFSRNFVEFWKRWHISLSQWFFEYVYYPLVHRRPTKLGHILAVMVTFTLSGFWHGANWTFLIWGLLNGTLYLLTNIFKKPQFWNLIPKFCTSKLKILVTFHLICFCWIFFRAPSVASAFAFIKHLFLIDRETSFKQLDVDFLLNLFFSIIGIIALWISNNFNRSLNLNSKKSISLVIIEITLLIFIGLLFSAQITEDFIYFQF